MCLIQVMRMYEPSTHDYYIIIIFARCKSSNHYFMLFLIILTWYLYLSQFNTPSTSIHTNAFFSHRLLYSLFAFFTIRWIDQWKIDTLTRMTNEQFYIDSFVFFLVSLLKVYVHMWWRWKNWEERKAAHSIDICQHLKLLLAHFEKICFDFSFWIIKV